MKKSFIFVAAALVLALSACENSVPAQPVDDGDVLIDDECPRADGQPCR